MANAIGNQSGNRDGQHKQRQSHHHADDAGVEQNLFHRQAALAARLRKTVRPKEQVEYNDIGSTVEHTHVAEDGLLQRDGHIAGVGKHHRRTQHTATVLVAVAEHHLGQQD